MKFHCHIPALHQFALDSACDDVVKHGKQGVKPMPRPLYYRCIQTYAEKKSNVLSIMKLFKANRSLREPDSGMERPSHACAIVALQHVIVEDYTDDLLYYVFVLLGSWHRNIDGVVSCIHNFAGRCRSLHALDAFYAAMTMGITQYPSKCIGDVLLSYNVPADIQHNEDGLKLACRLGRASVVRQIRDGITVNYSHLIASIESNDIDTVSCISDRLVGETRVVQQDTGTNTPNISLELCQFLVQSGIFKMGSRCNITSISSLSVLKYLLDNNLIDSLVTYFYSLYNALLYGGAYNDIYCYFIEQEGVITPNDILSCCSVDDTTDLSLLDYVIAHGADVNAREYSVPEEGILQALNVAVQTPSLLRYWLDNGLTFELNSYVKELIKCIDIPSYRHSFICAIRVLVHMFGFDVNAKVDGDDDDNTLLHLSVKPPHLDVLNGLIELGANVNAVNKKGATVLHRACQYGGDEAVLMLIKVGANVHARDNAGYTPMHYACYSGAPSVPVMEVLLRNGAKINCIDNSGNTPLHIACMNSAEAAPITWLLEHDAAVNVVNHSFETPLCACHHHAGVIVQGIVDVLIENGGIMDDKM